jgi:hypothetical protein
MRIDENAKALEVTHMVPDILIIRDRDGYRLLHGYLHLANALDMSGKVKVDVRGEGQVGVIRSRDGYLVEKDGERLPLVN